jgi:hypothetical protein
MDKNSPNDYPSDSTAPTGEESARVNKSMLSSKAAILVVGQLGCISLQTFGQVCFFLNAESEVEIAPVVELQADGLDIDTALGALIRAGYADDALLRYVKGRQAREQNAMEWAKHFKPTL